MKKLFTFIVLTLTFVPVDLFAQEAVFRNIEFPVDGEYTLTDSFGDPRSGGRIHEGVDIFANKMTPLVSAVDGVVSFITFQERDYGNAVFIRDEDDWQYWYLHINNDTPGTD